MHLRKKTPSNAALVGYDASSGASGACGRMLTPRTSPASRKGTAYISTSGDPMPNHGEKLLVVKMPSGKLVTMRNQVTNCTGPLTSVATMVDADNFVGFGKAGSFILDMEIGSVDWLERVDNTFEMEFEVLPYAEAKRLLKSARFQGRC